MDTVVQEAVELVRLRLEQVGFSGKTPVWNAAFKEVTKAKSLIGTPDMLKGMSDVKQPKAKQLVSLAQTKLRELGEAVRKQDIRSTLSLQEECSELVYNVRALSMKQGELPFEVPTEFDNLPQLKGRAIVECNLEKTNEGFFRLEDGTKTNAITLTLTIDGYHAPITAGTFADLVERKFYDGLSIQSAEELIVQTGNPEDVQVDGFIDPYTKEKRVIPLELFYKNDKAPTYSYTNDDDMRETESMAMPFQAYGALGMAHDPEDPNTASSQFWFLKWNQALVAPSRNTLDGSQACFGYVTKNQELLSQVEKGDKITRMKLVQGGENLVTNRREFSSSSDDLSQEVD
jgi:peptidylprolyl isomerase